MKRAQVTPMIIPIQIKSCFPIIAVKANQIKSEVLGVADKSKRYKLHKYFSC